MMNHLFQLFCYLYGPLPVLHPIHTQLSLLVWASFSDEGKYETRYLETFITHTFLFYSGCCNLGDSRISVFQVFLPGWVIPNGYSKNWCKFGQDSIAVSPFTNSESETSRLIQKFLQALVFLNLLPI